MYFRKKNIEFNIRKNIFERSVYGMNNIDKKHKYEHTKEYAEELFAKGMCMGEVMKKANLTEEKIAETRKELDEEE